MQASLNGKLEKLMERFEEVSGLLSDPDIIADQKQFRSLSKEYAELEAVVKAYRAYRASEQELESARALLDDGDPEMREMGAEEARHAQQRIDELDEELQRLLLPRDPRDGADVYLEIRAGTGGDEAALFAGDLFKMYSRYADQRGWKVEIVSASEGEHGGYKEVIAQVSGDDVYSRLKFESGAHRVQRVPATESQGRIHTSACTVAVLAAAEDAGDIEIRNEDLRIDTHGSAVSKQAWDLLGEAYAHFGPVPTLLERDFNFPPLEELLEEVRQIKSLQASAGDRPAAETAHG